MSVYETLPAYPRRNEQRYTIFAHLYYSIWGKTMKRLIKHKDELNVMLLASGNLPLVYVWFTTESNSILMSAFGVVACVALDMTVVLQSSKKQKNIFTWLAIVSATLFTSGIAIELYGTEGYLHSAFSIVLLFVSLSNSIEVSQKHSKAVSARVKTEPKHTLTAKEQQVYDYLREQSITETSNRDLAQAMGLNESSVRVYVKGLRDKGYLSGNNGVITLA